MTFLILLALHRLGAFVHRHRHAIAKVIDAFLYEDDGDVF